jgi:hypothetical protein
MYGADIVPGDVALPAWELKVGDVIRMFDGFHDTATVTFVDREIVQGGAWHYTLDTDSSLPRASHIPSDRVYYLAIGPARPSL